MTIMCFFIVGLLVSPNVNSFTTPFLHQNALRHCHIPRGCPAKRASSALHVSWWDQDEESRHTAQKHNIIRTDFRNFLTQRAIQSFLKLCIECRDPHTVKWLEEFGEWGNLENFHGTGALNITRFPYWSSAFMDLMKVPNDVVIVSAKRRGRGVGGWSKNNPYLEVRAIVLIS
jgi:hypothetical protein